MSSSRRQSQYNLNDPVQFDQMMVDMETQHLEELREQGSRSRRQSVIGLTQPPLVDETLEDPEAPCSPSRRRSFPPNERYSPNFPTQTPRLPIRQRSGSQISVRSRAASSSSRRGSMHSPRAQTSPRRSPSHSPRAATHARRSPTAASFEGGLPSRSPTFFGQDIQSPPAPGFPASRSSTPPRTPTMPAMPSPASPPRYSLPSPTINPTSSRHSPSPTRRSSSSSSPRFPSTLLRYSPTSPQFKATSPRYSSTVPRYEAPSQYDPANLRSPTLSRSPTRRMSASATSSVLRTTFPTRYVGVGRRASARPGSRRGSLTGEYRSPSRASYRAADGLPAISRSRRSPSRPAVAVLSPIAEASPENSGELFGYGTAESDDEVGFGPSASERMSEAAQAESDAHAVALRLEEEELYRESLRTRSETPRAQRSPVYDVDDRLLPDEEYAPLFDELFAEDVPSPNYDEEDYQENQEYHEDRYMHLDGADDRDEPLEAAEEDRLVLELHDSDLEHDDQTSKPKSKKRKASPSPSRKAQKVARRKSASQSPSSSRSMSTSRASATPTRRSSRIRKNAASKASSSAGKSQK